MAKSDRTAREPKKSALEKLHDYIRTTVAAFPAVERGNKGRMLHEIWVWQEVCALAGAAEKQAWQAAQLGEDSLIPPDAELRLESGETIVADSAGYSCVVRVDKPRSAFDRDTFIALVCREYKIPAAEMLRLVERAKAEGTAPLTKRIVPTEAK